MSLMKISLFYADYRWLEIRNGEAKVMSLMKISLFYADFHWLEIRNGDSFPNLDNADNIETGSRVIASILRTVAYRIFPKVITLYF